MPHTKEPVVVRVGLHSGPVVSGLVGTAVPKFGLFVSCYAEGCVALPWCGCACVNNAWMVVQVVSVCVCVLCALTHM